MIKALVITIVLLIVIGSVFFVLNQTKAEPIAEQLGGQSAAPTLPSSYTASFAIYTNGVKRSFTLPMYHNQSEDIYIESSEPETIQVREQNRTWRDFFNTLPFTVTDQCLRTGTGESFCTGENGTLRFFLNEEEKRDALDDVILPNDRFVIVFGQLPKEVQ